MKGDDISYKIEKSRQQAVMGKKIHKKIVSVLPFLAVKS